MRLIGLDAACRRQPPGPRLCAGSAWPPGAAGSGERGPGRGRPRCEMTARSPTPRFRTWAEGPGPLPGHGDE